MLELEKIVFFGGGAIGASTGAWVAEKYDKTYFYARGKSKEALQKNGITHYFSDGTNEAQREETLRNLHPVQILENLDQISNNDAIVLSVKNYSLMEAAKQIYDQCGDNPLIISLANGKKNQEILPKYFTRIIYGVIVHNAWREMEQLEKENKLIVGSQRRGPLIIGTPDNKLKDEMQVIKGIFDLGVETIITEELQNAVHNKIAINLVNALTTLTGYGIQPISDFKIFQELVINQIWEGVQILQAAGFQEYELPGITPWSVLETLMSLPISVTHEQFKENMSKMQISSMTQDIIQKNLGVSELESINGYILKLADQYNIEAPYNRTVYNLSKKLFRKNFQPIDVTDILTEVKKII
ncbi:MAG: ketopantoate reductase family protein [Candidatus Hermodarchaeota archaeon]